MAEISMEPKSDLRRLIDHLPEKQRDVLGQICLNNDMGHHPKTLAALERKGLIISGVEIDHSYRFLLKLTRYAVPDVVHMTWCEWCSDNVPDCD